MGAKRMVLTTHVRPDGDGIASELALAHILRKNAKQVQIVNHDQTPEMYRWLPGAEGIVSLDDGAGKPLPAQFDLGVLLDCAAESRIGEAARVVKRSSRIISIDHHEYLECYRDYCYINTDASSIGEILYRLLPDPAVYLDRDIATCLYASIIWDTGSFAYSNTSAKVFRIVSRLLEYGVDPANVYAMTFNSKSLAHFRLLGEALKMLKIDASGRIVSLIIPLSVYRDVGAREEDNEGILEVIKGLKNVDLIIFLRQLTPEKFKGSLRSVNMVDCNYLANLFDGGGHQKASGFVQDGDVERAGRSVVDRIIGEVHEKGWI